MMMAERPEVPGRLVLDVNPRKKAIKSALAMGTVSSVSIVIPQAVEQTLSAPSSPNREEKRSKGFLKHLTRPKSPIHRRKHSHSDPERTPSPQPSSHRPRWLGFKKKKKNDINGATTPVEGASPSPSDSGSSLEQQCEKHLQSLTISPPPPSATSADQLPGAIRKTDSGPCIPVIMVSSHSEYEEEQLRTSGSSVSFEDMNGSGDPLEPGGNMTRKLSQSSQKSACSSTLQSVGTSGVGSLLSPSEDESFANSDLESPMSPLSRTSSFTTEGETEGQHSDTDPIDADLHPSLASPVSDPEMQVTTPTKDGLLDFSPTAGSKKELGGRKKKKDKVRGVISRGRGCVNICGWCVFVLACN
jgi:hypothetical protein